MSRTLKQVTVSGLMAALMVIGTLAEAQPIQALHRQNVSNTTAFLAAMDQLFESDDMTDHQVSIWAAVFDGDDPTTHVIVENFDGYATYEAQTQRRTGSDDWPRFINATSATAEVIGSSLRIQRFADGVADGHDAAAVFSMSVSDPATYTAAFTEFVDAVENLGRVSVMEVRAGGMGATHHVTVTANNMTALNEFLDTAFASDAFRAYSDKVSDIRTVITVNMYRRVRTYGN